MSNLSPDFILPENFCANPQEAWTIPARFYTDQNAFEHEKENVFAKSWICVAHSSELANANDYVTREIIGESIVLYAVVIRFCARSITCVRTVVISC